MFNIKSTLSASRKKSNNTQKQEKVSYSIVRSNVKSSDSKKLMSFDEEMDIEQGDFIVFKRAKLREHNELGYDYAGTIVSPALVKNYYKTKINSLHAIILGIVFVVFSCVITAGMILSDKPFLWFNQEHLSGNFFSDSLFTIFFGYLLFMVSRTIIFTLKSVNKARWKNISSFWADISFEIAEKNLKKEAFKDLLIRWDYVEENFVNETVAESFDKYIHQLTPEQFSTIVKQGIVLSVFDEYDENEEDILHNELFKEAKVHGDKVKQLIIENFRREFNTEKN